MNNNFNWHKDKVIQNCWYAMTSHGTFSIKKNDDRYYPYYNGMLLDDKGLEEFFDAYLKCRNYLQQLKTNKVINDLSESVRKHDEWLRNQPKSWFRTSV